MAKALSVSNFLTKKYEVFELEGKWREFINQPESKGIWFVWGGSGNGKSSFLFQLCKELAQHGKTCYDSLEEGDSKTMKDKIIQHSMVDVKGNFEVVNEPPNELLIRMAKRNSARIYIVDSVPYTGLTWKTYLAFKKRVLELNKTVIFSGHAQGKNPKGDLSDRIMYDAYIKIWVEGYRAFSKGREIGSNGGVFTIWEEGANRYWGDVA